MYLTDTELTAILRNPYYTTPFTTSLCRYRFYRGRTNASVVTVRFNIAVHGTLDEPFIRSTLFDHVSEHFGLHTTLRASVLYDVLLENIVVDDDEPHERVRSFYIWRANTNRRTFDDTADEILMSLNLPNMTRFVTDAVQVHVPDLNIQFTSSKVSINRLLALVFTFVNV